MKCGAAILFVYSSVLAMAPASAAVRQYYVSAEDQSWDFAPTGLNLVHCIPGPAPCEIPEPWTSSHTFPVTRYIQYTDDTLRTPVRQPPWLGILGPIIRAEVGDTVRVHFCNRSGQGVGMHPHGFRYDKDNEGGHYFGANSGVGPGAGAEIDPGQCFDYVWTVDADAGPAAGDPSSKVWWYHSHIDEPADINSGLLGPIIVTRRGWARPDATPVDVSREFVTAFVIFDKLEGEEPGLMHSINGYIFGNLKGLVMHQGEKVRWHLLGMGNEVDLHTPHWHGKTVTVGGPLVARRTDVVELLPATMITADMNADNSGEWMFHCHVADHINAGMFTSYQID